MLELPVVLEIASIALLLYLLYEYVQNYREMKTAFGAGLVIFALFLLVQNALSAYFHLMMTEYYSAAVMGHALWVTGAQTLALFVLAVVTWRN